MALNASKIKNTGGKKFKRPPALEAGTYPARLVQIIDLGLQPQQAWQGEEKPPKPMIYTTYELLDEFMLDEDGNELTDKPRWQSEDFTMNSLESDLAKSTKRYLALDPSLEYGGDWAQLLGAPAMVTITAKPSTKGAKDDDGNVIVHNNIASVQTMRDKDAKKAGELVNKPKVFDLSDPDIEVFLSLPDWLRDKIKDNLEFGGSALEKALENIDGKSEIAKRREANKEASEKAKEKKDDKPKEEPEASDGDDW